MSWEEDYRHEYPCFCGKGKRIEVGRSDDWGRSETSSTLDCEDCNKKYVYAFVDPYRAYRMKSDGYAWITREDYERYKREEAEEKKAEQQKWKEKLDAIAPPHMGMKQKEIVSLMKSTFPTVSFNRSASKSKLIEDYHQWAKYFTTH